MQSENTPMSAPVDAAVMPCECLTWGRYNHGTILHLDHHPNCKLYRPEPEIRELLLRLIDGIEAWASDEDGVHPDCWEPYKAACAAVGQWDRVEE
jgi:hypothetical protein